MVSSLKRNCSPEHYHQENTQATTDSWPKSPRGNGSNNSNIYRKYDPEYYDSMKSTFHLNELYQEVVQKGEEE